MSNEIRAYQGSGQEEMMFARTNWNAYVYTNQVTDIGLLLKFGYYEEVSGW